MTVTLETQVQYDLWIGGSPTAATGGSTIPVLAPSTGEECGHVGDASDQDAIAAVTAAHDALGPWRRTAPRERAEILRRCFELMTG